MLDTSNQEDDAAGYRADGCCCVVVKGLDGDVQSSKLFKPVVVIVGSGFWYVSRKVELAEDH